MEFPGSNTYSVDRALTALTSSAGYVRGIAVDMKTRSLAGNVTSTYILTFLSSLKATRATMAGVSSTPGLAAYAQAQFNNGTYDIVAKYSTMLSALDATISWLATNFPKDGSNYLLAVQMDAQGATADRQFTTSDLAGLRTQLDSLIVTIDP